jgi:2-octaprenyl-6-methoxyphenol hydroxylase
MIIPKADICSCEIAVIGGGMVGMTLAIALAQAGFDTVLLDELPPETAIGAGFDGRVSAIAFASRRLYQTLGLWDALAPDAEPICDIVVSDGRVKSGASSLFLHFDHAEIGDEPLGHIVENRHTRLALLSAAKATPHLQLWAPARAVRVDRDGAHADITLADGRRLTARLCVGAEGRNSPLRREAGIKSLGWSYGQTGIVATVAHEKPHQGLAQEYFLPSGPFAILPMTGNRSSLVWTEHGRAASAFLALDEAGFDAEVARRVGTYLGETRVVGPRFSYPLSLQLAARYVLPRLAIVGDAAHAIHPIAGQGLNLGLRDVAALAEIVTDAGRQGSDIGALSVLEQYQRWRRFDSMALAAVTDLLTRLFSNDIAPLRLARDLGLAVTSQIGGARRFFMRHAGGAVGQLPRLLRGEPL